MSLHVYFKDLHVVVSVVVVSVVVELARKDVE